MTRCRIPPAEDYPSRSLEPLQVVDQRYRPGAELTASPLVISPELGISGLTIKSPHTSLMSTMVTFRARHPQTFDPFAADCALLCGKSTFLAVPEPLAMLVHSDVFQRAGAFTASLAVCEVGDADVL
jgi:hypothetical protein